MNKTRKFLRKKPLLVLLANVLCISIIFISSYHTTNRLEKIKSSKSLKYLSSLITAEDKRKNETVVLVWTEDFAKQNFTIPSWSLIDKTYQNCFHNCRITHDRRYLTVSDAIVFHSQYLRKDEMPPLRTNSQVYVYLQQESPSYTKADLSKYKNIFNWTMTYRRDSDIYHPYFITQRIHDEKGNDQNLKPNTKSNIIRRKIQKKTKLIAWIASNCHTVGKRETYVEELNKFIQVDIYGDCGSYKCVKNEKDCFPNIAEEYKFYLSFENSLCVDYISETFSTALQHNIVPMVYGGGEYQTMAPPKSYINTKNFNSPRDLAEYLLYLDKNPEKYFEYFRWKENYNVNEGSGWCSLCKRLYQQKINPVRKTYENLKLWWNTQNRSTVAYHGHINSHSTTNSSLISACYKPDVTLTYNNFGSLWKKVINWRRNLI